MHGRAWGRPAGRGTHTENIRSRRIKIVHLILLGREIRLAVPIPARRRRRVPARRGSIHRSMSVPLGMLLVRRVFVRVQAGDVRVRVMCLAAVETRVATSLTPTRVHRV